MAVRAAGRVFPDPASLKMQLRTSAGGRSKEGIMGRIVDLLGEIAAAAEEGGEGLVLPTEAWERLRADWDDEEIDDALGLVHDSLLQADLVESADSLGARLVEVLGTFGQEAAVEGLAAGRR